MVKRFFSFHFQRFCFLLQNEKSIRQSSVSFVDERTAKTDDVLWGCGGESCSTASASKKVIVS